MQQSPTCYSGCQKLCVCAVTTDGKELPAAATALDSPPRRPPFSVYI